MLKNSPNTYGILSKSFHWIIALIVFGLLILGFYLDEISYGVRQTQLLSLHKSFGLLILWLIAFRILWNFYTKKPDVLPSHAKWERILAKCTHVFLYSALIGMPLSGWVMSMSGGYSVSFFGLDVPSFIDRNKQINEISWQIHKLLAAALIAGIFLHVIGALKHHFIDKDNTLKRMAFRPNSVFIYGLLSVLVIFMGVLVRLFIF